MEKEKPEERKMETEDSQSRVEKETEMEISNESVNVNPGPSTPLKIEEETETLKQTMTKIIREFLLQHGKSETKVAGEKEKGKNPDETEKKERIQIGLENEAENETPTTKALKNPLVIKMIIRNLSCSSLLSCRLVNKLWLALCTEILSKSRDENEDALRISFRYCGEAGTYIKNFDGILRGEIKTLDSLNQFLKKMSKTETETETARSFSYFPCPNFAFEDLDLSRPKIQKFFKLQGSKIKGLRLNFDNFGEHAATTESFTDLLMNKTPNVECLTLSEIPYFWQIAIPNWQNPQQILNIERNLQGDKTQNRSTRADLPAVSLAKLRCLRFSHQDFYKPVQVIVKEIALSSPALKTVVGLKEPVFDKDFDFDYLTSISKGHLITEVNLVPKVKNMQILTNFVQSQPPSRLKHLTLSLDFVENRRHFHAEQSISFESFVPMASALLESSKKSLEYFSMPKGKRVTRFLQLDDFPVLQNVRVVGLHCRERPSQIWPIPAKQFKRIFPNARELSLSGEERGGGILTFPNEAPVPVPAPSAVAIGTSKTREIAENIIPQITNLHLQDDFSRQFLNNIPLIFVNVVELCIQNNHLLPVLPLIWRFGLTNLRLKVLDLEISMDQNPNPNPNLLKDAAPPANADVFANLYPVLTFPQLDAALTGFPEEACAQLLSIYPKILDEEIVKAMRINPSILDLKYLEEFRLKFRILEEGELPENILTVVSGAYAFGWESSKLQVHIETKLDPGLDKITSALISKKQRTENLLKPLLPYAKMTFAIDLR